jgi:PTS system nitrogen regulatory IIA component
MQIADLLKADGVKLIASATSKKRLFHSIGELAASCYGLNATDVVEALVERESLGPTSVGHGIALPHARLDGLDRVCGLFIRLEKPLDFDSVDRQPVDLVFALFAPTQAGVEHLKALALVSRTMRDPATCTKLRSNTDAATLHTILTERPASQAA